MKVSYLTAVVTTSLCLLSGCAYMQGLKDQRAAEAQQAQHPHAQEVKISGPARSISHTAPSASSTASQTIAPLTQ